MTQNIQKKFNEQQNALRLYIMECIIDWERPFHLEEDAQKALHALGITMEEYEDAVKCLIEKDGMVIDEEKNVNFIYPVSALGTGHRVTLADGREFCAMCAIDAIGAAFTFHQDTEVHSSCAICEEPVFIKITDGKVESYSPETLHALTFPLGEIADWAGSC